MIILFLFQKRKILFNRNIAEIKLENEKTLLNTQLEIHEQVLENISREIHDNIGLSLTLAKLNLNTADTLNSVNTQEKISHSVELITSAIQDLRNLSQSMNAELVRNNGLIKTLEEEVRRIERLGKLKINFKIHGEPTFLDNKKELLLFRIVQESMNNIIKHADASEAHISLEYANDNLKMLIADNGRGFELSSPMRTGGSGLSNMLARANMLNGTMDIDSGQRGTTLTFLIPYN